MTSCEESQTILMYTFYSCGSGFILDLAKRWPPYFASSTSSEENSGVVRCRSRSVFMLPDLKNASCKNNGSNFSGELWHTSSLAAVLHHYLRSPAETQTKTTGASPKDLLARVNRAQQWCSVAADLLGNWVQITLAGRILRFGATDKSPALPPKKKCWQVFQLKRSYCRVN